MTEKEDGRLGVDPVAPPARSLGAAFDPQLRGALPARKRAASPAPETETTSTPAKPKKARQPQARTSPGPPAARQANDEEPAGRATASQRADGSLTKGRVLYLSDEIRDALATACAQRRKTRTVVVLQAIEGTYEDLEDLVAQDLAPKVVPGRLWDSVVTPSRMDQPPKRQVFITPTIEQLRIIDHLVTDSGARDRSHLVSVALRTHLRLA